MAEEQNNKSKLPLICGIVSVLLAAVLLIFTELIFRGDSVLLQWIKMLFLIFALVPFILMKVSNENISKFGSIACVVITFITCCLLYYGRNKVSFVFVPNELKTDQDTINKLVAKLKPSGVLIIGGTKDLIFPEDIGQESLCTEETSKALVKRENGKETEKGFELSSNKITKINFSGLQNRLVLYLEDMTKEEAETLKFEIMG